MTDLKFPRLSSAPDLYEKHVYTVYNKYTVYNIKAILLV